MVLKQAADFEPGSRAEPVSKPLPVTERGKRSRQNLLDAAERVFGRKGFHETSIADIAREARAAHGSFYVYFLSKEEIFIAVLESLNQVFRTRTKGKSAKGRDFFEAEMLGLEELFELVVEHRSLFRILRQSDMVDPDLSRRYYARFAEGYVRRIKAAIARGEIRGDVHPEACAYSLIGIADFVSMRWPYWTGKRPPAAVRETVRSMIRSALLPVAAAAPRRRAKQT